MQQENEQIFAIEKGDPKFDRTLSSFKIEKPSKFLKRPLPLIINNQPKSQTEGPYATVSKKDNKTIVRPTISGGKKLVLDDMLSIFNSIHQPVKTKSASPRIMTPPLKKTPTTVLPLTLPYIAANSVPVIHDKVLANAPIWYVGTIEDGIKYPQISRDEIFRRYLLDQIDLKNDLIWQVGFDYWYPILMVPAFQAAHSGELDSWQTQGDSVVNQLKNMTPVSSVKRPPGKWVQPTSEDSTLEYLSLVENLKLGEPKKIFKTVFLLPTLTLGLYIPFWVFRTCQEIFFHESEQHNVFLPALFTLMMFVPGLHIFASYKLAIKIENFEKDVTYSQLNASTVAFYWALPLFFFLFMMRIQHALNKHWQNHILDHYLGPRNPTNTERNSRLAGCQARG